MDLPQALRRIRQMNYTPKPLLMQAPCIPSERTTECRDCKRLSGPEAITPKYPVIDATKVDWPDGVCPMFISLVA